MARGAKQPKIKIAQPVQLEAALRDVLEKHGVRKPPTVDKVEALEKAATAKKWLFFVTPDRRDGLTHVKLEVPGPDGLIYFEATALTTALAMTKALCDALENGPQQANFLDSARSPDAPPDPDGKDLPMFKGNGGVASVAEINLQETAYELAKDIDQAVRDGEIAGVAVRADGTIGDAQRAADIPVDREDWRFLFHVSPLDLRLWKAEVPTDADGPILEWEEGGENAQFDRGWYLAERYTYDPKAGEIRLSGHTAADDAAWSRNGAGKKQRAGYAPKASNVTPDQAEALAAAGVSASAD